LRLAAKEVGLPDLGGALSGQLAVVTGPKDISAAAKVLKTFASEFDKPKLRFGFLDNQRLEAAQLATLADLPSMEVCEARCLV
jgi:large subunit ribosomal protein L10